jgi:hypothetical protein
VRLLGILPWRVTEELRSILNFIKHDGRSQLFEEGTWVTANPSLNVWIFKENVLGLGEQLAEKGRFSGAARPSYHYGWKMSRRFLNDISQLLRDIAHLSIVKQYFRIIKLQALWIYLNAWGQLLQTDGPCA